MTKGVAKSELKEWAKKHMVGVEGCIFPSFNPDMSDLDEEGIRWDVQQSIKHGFFSVLVSTETGLTFDEARRFVEIVADEARDKILVSTTLLFDSLEKNREMLRHAEKAGCDSVLFGYPPGYYPQSEEDIFLLTKEMCESTNLAVVLYPSPNFNFARFHFSGFNPKLLARMAEFDNAVAAKVGEPGLAADCIRLFGDRILINNPVERMLPLMVLTYGQQWIGAGCYEVFQSPEKPFMVRYFNLLREGRVDEAMDIYWMLTPARVIFEQNFQQQFMVGQYHWTLQKYYQWLVGGNGGYTRQPCMKMFQHVMEQTKMGLRMIGITPREPDEEFYIGRMNYERMKKPCKKKPWMDRQVSGEDLQLDVSDLSLPDAFDQEISISSMKGEVVVLAGGGQGAVDESKKWAASLYDLAARIGFRFYGIGFLGKLPTFIPRDAIKETVKAGPPALLDWDGN
ncbi:MAG: dihydrodipicolinate synthase family protein, partial [Desulfocucumaceae bacterium]